MSSIISFTNKASIISGGTCVGKLESEGPLNPYFDLTDEDSKFGMDTWEKAESEMIRRAFQVAVKKSGAPPERVDLVYSGDLSNQCTASSLGMKDCNLPYIGLYGACSTFALGIGLSAMAMQLNSVKLAASLASSHYSSAERQYRFPLEYGCQRTPTAQTTVTGAGCLIYKKDQEGFPYVSEALFGKIVDLGITDANNMGAAMAPAAADTVVRYFMEKKLDPNQFDSILTGDLGYEGHRLFLELCESKGIRLGNNCNDCGKMIFDCNRQETNAGGSGCGCSAVVFSGFILDQFAKDKMKDVLLIGTGALLNPSTVLQKESIPGVAHLVRIRSDV